MATALPPSLPVIITLAAYTLPAAAQDLRLLGGVDPDYRRPRDYLTKRTDASESFDGRATTTLPGGCSTPSMNFSVTDQLSRPAVPLLATPRITEEPGRVCGL